MSNHRVFTNTRPSLVHVADTIFLPGETKSIPDKFISALNEQDSTGEYTHPLRFGNRPILAPGIAEMPEPIVPEKVETKFAQLPAHEMSAMLAVRASTSIDELAAWHATETRPAVVSALTTRGAQLRAGV
jgi:hypothetical protein